MLTRHLCCGQDTFLEELAPHAQLLAPLVHERGIVLEVELARVLGIVARHVVQVPVLNWEEVGRPQGTCRRHAPGRP